MNSYNHNHNETRVYLSRHLPNFLGLGSGSESDFNTVLIDSIDAKPWVFGYSLVNGIITIFNNVGSLVITSKVTREDIRLLAFKQFTANRKKRLTDQNM